MGLFGPKLPIDSDEFEWQLACFKWMLEDFEQIERHRQTPLVTPTTDYFPDSSSTGHTRARELFDQVRSHAGLENVAFRLEAGAANRPDRVQPGFGLRHESAPPLGTYRVEDRGHGHYEPVITYNPSSLADPARLVGTFAHELAHYVIDGAGRLPPGGADLHELATDLTAVFMGFGIFLANGAKTFDAFNSFDSMGWSSSQSGYLSEKALVTGLAITQRLAGRDPMDSARWLKPHLASDIKKAAAYLAKRHPDIETDIMAIDLADYGMEFA